MVLGTLRYVISEIKQNYDRRTWWRNRFASRVLSPIQSKLYNDSSAVDVSEESWDLLIILDACRADLFEEVVDTTDYDHYEVKKSRGSATREWTKANFNGRAKTDTIYVTGNPVVSYWVDTAFAQFEEVWQDNFDPDLGTVPAESVTERAIQVHKDNPDKRLIVHYLQPHYPFVEDPELRFTKFEGTDELEVTNVRSGAADVWEAVGLGLVDPNEAWAGYRRNLEYVLDAIDPLLEIASGKVVITSDHGNALGERARPIPIKLYGHPTKIYHPVLRKVPWAEIRAKNGRADSEEKELDADVEDKLRQLGYV
ncbi:hypothetical protein HPS36_00240 [Halorubrum salinarum]|uniref:Uncharacterized protein n=1 Tax=Halorubrum salinarum TaxID=2739057 RepID=A0A7D4D2G5_9EURY|nr:hypothetical protein [Halorubrum salinarum]QKG91342.1 hypothetical protein HPS36_00240 [Halorubrum salinarum]